MDLHAATAGFTRLPFNIPIHLLKQIMPEGMCYPTCSLHCSAYNEHAGEYKREAFAQMLYCQQEMSCKEAYQVKVQVRCAQVVKSGLKGRANIFSCMISIPAFVNIITPP